MENLIGNQCGKIGRTHLEAYGLPGQLCGAKLLADGAHGREARAGEDEEQQKGNSCRRGKNSSHRAVDSIFSENDAHRGQQIILCDKAGNHSRD